MSSVQGTVARRKGDRAPADLRLLAIVLAITNLHEQVAELLDSGAPLPGRFGEQELREDLMSLRWQCRAFSELIPAAATPAIARQAARLGEDARLSEAWPSEQFLAECGWTPLPLVVAG